MSRICVFIRSLADGGAEKQALLLTKALREEHRPTLVAVSDQPQARHHLDFVRAHDLDFVALPARPRKMTRFLRLHRADPFQAAFCFLPGDTLFGAMAGKLGGIPFVFGGLRNTRIQTHKERVLRWLHNRILYRTITNSHAASRAFAASGFDPAKLIVIPNGIVLDPERHRARTADELRSGLPLRILSVGRLVPQKDHTTALRAVKQARDAGLDLRYTLIGHGQLEASLRAEIRHLGLADVVHLQAIHATEEHFRSSDVFLNTSHHEGLSNSIMEAMSHSLPVIATDAGDNDRLVASGENGFVRVRSDAQGIADLLLRLGRDPDERARLGAASRQRIERYSYEAFQKAYLSVLNEALASREPSHAVAKR